MTGSQGVALKYKRVYLIFTTKMPGVAEVADFYDSYYCYVTWGCQGVAITYKRVYLLFTTKLPGVAEVAAFL